MKRFIIQTFDPRSTGPRRWQYAGESVHKCDAIRIANQLKARFGDNHARVLETP